MPHDRRFYEKVLVDVPGIRSGDVLNYYGRAVLVEEITIDDRQTSITHTSGKETIRLWSYAPGKHFVYRPVDAPTINPNDQRIAFIDGYEAALNTRSLSPEVVRKAAGVIYDATHETD